MTKRYSLPLSVAGIAVGTILVLTQSLAMGFNSFPFKITRCLRNVHADITFAALSQFFNGQCKHHLTSIADFNTQQDLGQLDVVDDFKFLKPNLHYHPEHHFDRLVCSEPECGPADLPAAHFVAFDRGRQFVIQQRSSIIGELQDHFAHPTQLSRDLALIDIGMALHAIQDFFSHSNFVDDDFGDNNRKQALLGLWNASIPPPPLLKLTAYSRTQGGKVQHDPYSHDDFSKDCRNRNDEAKMKVKGTSKYDLAYQAAVAATRAFVSDIANAVKPQVWSAFLDDCQCDESGARSFTVSAQLSAAALAGAKCVPLPIPVQIVTSNDPNDKVGAQGATAQRYLSGSQPLTYAIYFDNQPTASAPAQTVMVTDTLNPNAVNLNTLTLGPLSFVDKLVTPPSTPLATLGTYSTDVDLRPGNNLIVQITTSLNSTTGVLKWTFTSLDPATGKPTTDPLAGFLPPGTEGSVTFTVAPKTTTTGTQITNKATIVFDVNPPMDTLVWLNTIDNTAPTSKVSPLASTQTTSSFNVQWTGADVGSGVQDFTVYASDNGGLFTPWLTNTTASSATYSGQASHTYAFYSIARDLVGNIESSKTTAEATTTVTVALSPADLTITTTHAGTFTPGGASSAYTIWVSNIGAGPTVGTITVRDALPVGLTPIGLSGIGWSCDVATLACTRTDALASGANYPAITLTGQVRLFSPPFTFTNTATVSGGGEANTSNDTSEDRAVTVADGAPTVQVTVTTVPAGLKISVDDVVSASPRTFVWSVGGMHTIAIPSPQPSPFLPGVQYVFNNWTDGGALLHNVTVPASPSAFTAILRTP